MVPAPPKVCLLSGKRESKIDQKGASTWWVLHLRGSFILFIESIKRELKIKPIYEKVNCCLLLIDKVRAKDKTYI
jgi:hypothetical protein